MSESKDVKVNNSGMSWSWLATIILIILKAFGKINWTWFQVFLPALCGTGLGLVIIIASLIFLAIIR